MVQRHILERLRAVSLRHRVYAGSCAFFAVVCLLVTVAIISLRQQADYQDKLGLTSRSAAAIERANGLIYAVVMESRGIYMSSDPAASARYGENLLRRSRELADVVEGWERIVRSDDAALFAAFKTRIADFIRFRIELVRRATAFGQAAGREWGDNEANRTTRAALNADLEALGQIYARRADEIAALTERAWLVTWLIVLLGLLALGLAGYVSTVIRRSLIAPLHEITDTADRIAAGRVVVTVPHSERLDEVGKLGRAVQQLQDTLVRNQELRRLERTSSRQRDNLEIQLQESKRHLLAAINSMMPGLMMLDLEGKVVLMNQSYRKIYRLPPDLPPSSLTIHDLLRLRAEAGTFSGDVESYVESILSRIEQGRPAVKHVELKDGRVIRVVERPMNGGTGWVSTHEDFTEQRHLQRSLERTEQLLAAIVEATDEAIVAKDAVTLRYVFVNRAAEALFGIARSEMIGRTARDVFDAATAEWIEREDRRIQQADADTTIAMRTVETPGNGRRRIGVRRLPVAGQDGEPRMLLCLIEDRTAQAARVAG
ncbi:PAS-domain containing protein [Bosea sp. CS1GBMeth4]|uniref:PAS-domain containing protein n=1 Tax=Bosea sp. CS1GBMeth4 TaxID=1892849 RepID=UPI001645913E|nr:PAS-domain containing protein [Bosea sp. CS1GBMeth4]